MVVGRDPGDNHERFNKYSMALNLKLSAFWITFTLLLCHCWIVSGQSNGKNQLTKQEQSVLKKTHEAFLKPYGGGKLKNATGDAIPSLQTSYCSEDAYSDIVTGIVFPPEATVVLWEIKTMVAGELNKTHETWYELISDGTVDDAILRFYPGRVDPKYYGVNLIFNYTVTNNYVNITGFSGGDVTKVYKTPTVFNFGSDIAICSGRSAELTLENSETGFSYILQLNGVDLPTQEVAGSDEIPINFNVSSAGTYTVRAFANNCSMMMNGSAVVTVNPNPVLTVSPNVAICVSQSIPLSVSSNQDPKMDYVWSNGATTANITVSPTATTTYTVTGTNRDTGCTATGSVTVTVNPLPVVTITNPSPVCEGDALTLSANITGGSAPYTYSWTRPDNTVDTGSSLNLAPASVSSNGLYKLVVYDSKLCGSVEVSTSVTVNPLPVITLGALPSGAVCAGVPIDFTASGGTSYTFYLNGTEVQATSGDNTYTLAAPNNGDVVRVVGGDANACQQDVSYTVVVNPLPITDLSVSPSAAVCLGTNMTFTATGGFEYLFYVNNVPQGIWSTTNTFVSSTLANGSVVHAMVRTAAGCEAATSPITITINQATATLVADLTPANVCFNEFINFTAGGGTQYEFLVNGTIVQPLSADNTFGSNSLTTGAQVTVRVIDANGCEDVSDPITVTVFPTPSVTMSANPAAGVCSGTPITFTGHGAVRYAFKLNGVEVQPFSNSASYVLTTPHNNDVVAVVGEDANGCQAESIDFKVVVHPDPVTSLSVSPAATVCLGTTVTFTATGGSEYLFYVNNVAQGVWSTTNTFVSSTLNHNDRIYAMVRSGLNCEVKSDEIVMTVNQVVANISITGPVAGMTSICQGSTVTFTASPVGAADYAFYATRAGVDILLAQGTQNILNINNLQNNDEVFVRVTDANACVDNSDKIKVAIVALPVPVVDISPIPLCAGSNVNITATAGFDRYALYVNGAKVGPDQVSNVFTPAGLQNGDQVVVVAYDVVNASVECYGSSSPKTINFLPLPNISLSSDQALNTFCTGTNVTFTASNGVQYQFFVNGTMVRDFSPIATYSSNALNNGDVVTVIGIDANGCTNTSLPINVIVNQADASISSSDADNVICVGQSITFTGAGGVNYEFFLDGVSQGISNNALFVFTGVAAGTHSVMVRVEDANGCFDDSPVINFETLALPVATIGVDITAPVCSGTPFTFTAGGGVHYTFYVNNVEAQAFSLNNIFVTNALNDGDAVHVVVSNNDNCESTSNIITVQILDLPVITLSGNKPLACENEVVTFTASSAAAGMQYEFLVDGTVTQALSATTTFTYGAAGDFSVQVRGVDANGCEGLSNVVNVSVSQVDPTLTASSTITCFGEFVRLTAGGGVNYEFFRNGVSVQNGASNIYDYDAFNSGAQLFTVMVTNADGCTELSAALPIFVNDIPTFTFDDDDADNTVCAGESVTFTASGGDAYEFFVNNVSVQGPSASNVLVHQFTAEGTYNVYVQVINTTTGCSAGSVDIVINVNPVPVATLVASPSTNIIDGTSVTFTAGEPGREYEFYVNNVKVQDKSTNNLFVTNTLHNNDVVTVYVYNAFGCYSIASLTIRVLDGIDVLPVIPAVADYCEGDGGIVVTVPNPQGGITYRLIHQATNIEVGAPIEFNGGAGVSWNDVKVQPGHNPSVYIVEAYYALLPAEVLQMANSVTITENALPIVYRLSPYNVVFEGCASVDDLKLENSQLNVTYELFLNGTALGIPAIPGNGGELNFGKQSIVGEYTINAINDGSGCGILMDGRYTIKGEDVQSFNLTSDPANGNYCESAPGVLISLDGSEVNVRYLLYRNGVDTGEFVVGTGAAIDFGRQTVDGVYSVLIESATGCLYPMTGSVTVTKYAAPVAYDLSATNNGHYCVGDAGVEISVSGQQEDYVYTLLFNGNPVVPAVTHVGLPGAETIAFTFAGTYAAEGVYTVEATIPNVDCPQLMNGSVTVVADALPKQFDLMIDKATICAGDATSISILGSEGDVSYRLIHNPTSAVVETQQGNGGRLIFNNIAAAGEYSVEAIRTGSTTACSVKLTSTVTLSVVDRPLYLHGDVQLEDIPSDVSVTCGYVDIYVRNAQVGFTYQLYKEFPSGLVAVGGKSFVATANADDNVFTNISDSNGKYFVKVNNGSCEEQLEDHVVVNIPGAVTVFQILGDSEICNGDPGVKIKLSGSEVGVNYQLIEVRTGNLIETQPGSGGELHFTSLLRKPGEYKVVGTHGVSGCQADMTPYFDLKVNPLPISYQMVGSGNYCTGGAGAEIKLMDSELDVTYILQKVIGANQFEEKVLQGTGDEITFGSFTSGTYRVVAFNALTLCTSSMQGEVTIKENPPIDGGVAIDAETSFCANSTGALVTIHTPQENVLYEIRDLNNVLVADHLGKVGVDRFDYYITAAGHYSIWASYEGDGCLIRLQEFDVQRFDAPTQKYTVSSDVVDGCGSSGATIKLSGSEFGFVYSLNIYINSVLDESRDLNGTGDELTWDVTYNGSGTVRYDVVASNNGECQFLMGSVVISYKPAPAVLDLDVTPLAYCHDDLGVEIQLPNGAEPGIYYRLFIGDPHVFLKGVEASAVTTKFDGVYGAGRYYIQAVNITTGCSVWMNNYIEVVENPNPDASMRFFFAFENSEDDEYGTVGAGNLKLDHSVVGIDYHLFVITLDGTQLAVDTLSGTGNELTFDPVTLGGTYFVRAIDQTTGCISEIANRIMISENPLVAYDGFINLKTSEQATSLDIIQATDPAMIKYSIGIDKLYGLDQVVESTANIEFELITSFTYSNAAGETALFNTIGSATLNPVTGLLEYTKKLGFYGGDSLRYRITNKDIPTRTDIGTIFIFAGNNNADEDNPFLIPNAFSPNGDGINDRFIISLPKYIKEDGYRSKLEVFNRWGTRVYISKGAAYDNSWDGTSKEAAMFTIGDDLPSGTYFYVFKITFIDEVTKNEVSKELSGYIELRR